MASPNNVAEHEKLLRAVAFAKEKLRTCLKGHGPWIHGKCRARNIGSNKLPTRLIDVGGSGGSRDAFLFVPSTPNISTPGPEDRQPLSVTGKAFEEIPAQTPFTLGKDATTEMQYVALSYCWGTTQNFTTTSANLARMKERIHWDELPQTIKDAVSITRALGIQYLWVDALCIIQDSQEDWEAESKKMADVYGGAFLTISAALGPDVHNGLFQDSKVPAPSTAFPLSSPFRYDPLYSRAWALQERLLSKRLLIFSRYDLYWECDDSPPQRRDGANKFARILEHTHRLSPKLSTSDWHLIVEDYTCRNLTDERDKLPALSGLATVYYQATKKDYLAGLWRQSLIEDLLWRRDQVSYGKSGKSGVPSKYRAPSWSWASLDFNISFFYLQGFSPSTEVLGTYADAQVSKEPEYEGADWIHLRGPLLEADTMYGSTIWFDLGNSTTPLTWMDTRERPLSPNLWGSMSMEEFEWNYTSNMPIIWFLLLGIESGARPLELGLVLTKAKKSRDKFQRIGCFHIWKGGWSGPNLEISTLKISSIFIV
jgi:hypothetical protein